MMYGVKLAAVFVEYSIFGEKRILLIRLSADRWIAPSTCSVTHWATSSIRTFYSLIVCSEPTNIKDISLNDLT